MNALPKTAHTDRRKRRHSAGSVREPIDDRKIPVLGPQPADSLYQHRADPHEDDNVKHITPDKRSADR